DRRDGATDGFDKGTFAGSIGTNQSHQLARTNRERNAVENEVSSSAHRDPFTRKERTGHRTSRKRERRRRANHGAPSAAVMTPICISEGAMIKRDAKSASTTSVAPRMLHPSNKRRCSTAPVLRMRCGTKSPTKATIPAMATATPDRIAEAMTTSLRIRVTSTPKD